MTALAKQRRLRSACQEVQPWQRGTLTCSQPNVGAKVRQMAMTPPRGEPDKLAAEARKSHFEGDLSAVHPGTGAAAGRPLPHVWGTQYLRMDLPAA
ncbi:hypothetical protein LNP17_23015 [Klebsiella variicola subsp. variicola]|nr:hypothetical protein [Klebsiella variicola subsp. variicola]